MVNEALFPHLELRRFAGKRLEVTVFPFNFEDFERVFDFFPSVSPIARLESEGKLLVRILERRVNGRLAVLGALGAHSLERTIERTLRWLRVIRKRR